MHIVKMFPLIDGAEYKLFDTKMFSLTDGAKNKLFGTKIIHPISCHRGGDFSLETIKVALICCPYRRTIILSVISFFRPDIQHKSDGQEVKI